MTSITESIARVVAERMKSTRYLGFYRYRVSDDIGPSTKRAVPNLRPVDKSIGLPDLNAVDKSFGAHGIFSKMQQSADVIVGFEGGNLAAPFVAMYVPGDAAELELSSSGKVRVTSAKQDLIQLVAEPVAIASKVANGFVSAADALSSLGAWAALITPIVEPPVPGPPGPLAAALSIAIAKIGTFSSLASSIGSSFPTGCASTKLESV